MAHNCEYDAWSANSRGIGPRGEEEREEPAPFCCNPIKTETNRSNLHICTGTMVEFDSGQWLWGYFLAQIGVFSCTTTTTPGHHRRMGQHTPYHTRCLDVRWTCIRWDQNSSTAWPGKQPNICTITSDDDDDDNPKLFTKISPNPLLVPFPFPRTVSPIFNPYWYDVKQWAGI